ncbi:hypothetical protein F5878DRAFT_23398 [Lentinula raphanica]|uniref:Uncharacterized protein n=1 Tax=Lentinula raphanica TaxID=153919 RepID=A0AA38PEN5_9AGAR|nr:hypothetical protein F5878DRAFT_23398 [Lentinula raphanica]
MTLVRGLQLRIEGTADDDGWIRVCCLSHKYSKMLDQTAIHPVRPIRPQVFLNGFSCVRPTLKKMLLLLFFQLFAFSQITWGGIVPKTVNDNAGTSSTNTIPDHITTSPALSTPLVPISSPIEPSSSMDIPTPPANGNSSSSSLNSATLDTSIRSQLGPILGESIGGAVALGGFIIITLLLRKTSKQLGWPGESSPPDDAQGDHGGYESRQRPSPTHLGKQKQKARDHFGEGDEVYMLQTMGYRDDSNNSHTWRNYHASNSRYYCPRSTSITPTPDTMPSEAGISRVPTRAAVGPRPNPRLLPQLPSHLRRESEQSGMSIIDIEAVAKEVAKILMLPGPATPTSLGGETMIQGGPERASEKWNGDRMVSKSWKLEQERLEHGGRSASGSPPNGNSSSRESPMTPLPLYHSRQSLLAHDLGKIV